LKVTYDQNKLLREVKDSIGKSVAAVSTQVLEELRAVTPKDTGEASNSWEITNLTKTSFKVTNDEDYIKYLNAGSSKQAPANFIEKVVLDYGTARGNVVDYDN